MTPAPKVDRNAPRSDLPQHTVAFDVRQLDVLVKVLRRAEKADWGLVDYDPIDVGRVRRYLERLAPPLPKQGVLL